MPLMKTSILNPLGALSCGTGSLSAAIGKGGGLMPRSLPAASELGWLGVGGRGVGVGCWAAAGKTASIAARNAPAAGDYLIVLAVLPYFSGIQIQKLGSGRATL